MTNNDELYNFVELTYKRRTMPKLKINDVEINVTKFNDEDYICLTDMIIAKDGDFFVTDWLRNKNTLEYIGIWEKVYNPDFNYGEFAIIKNQAGLNRFKISVKDFVAKTNAISLFARAGRYGGLMLIKISHLNLQCGLVLSLRFILLKSFNDLKKRNKKISDGLPKENCRRLIIRYILVLLGTI